ncbi:MAG TPA: NAD(P)H-dependent oxidoreductase subunit E, partial [Vicinamibacterales bacterium]
MDIRPIDARPTEEEREGIDAMLGPPQSGWEGGSRGNARDTHVAMVGGAGSRARRHLLLPALQALQARVGWISPGGLGYVCERLNVPPAEAWGVATFYALLATSPRAKRVVHVCDDIACKCRGADELLAELERTVPTPSNVHRTDNVHRTSSAGRASIWLRSPCLGMCDQAPAALVTIAGEYPQEVQLGGLTPERVKQILDGRDDLAPAFRPAIRQPLPELRLLRRVGRVDPTSLDAYRESRGFEALAKARAIGAEAVIAEVTASKLMGRGGAAFPTGRKWDAVRREPACPHFLICNADESEP